MTRLLDGIREMAKQAFTEQDIYAEQDRRRQLSNLGTTSGRRTPAGRGSRALGSVLPRASSVARDVAAGRQPARQLARR